jgi:hypothetical protein
MSTRGMITTMTIEEPTDTDIFLTYVEQILCPVLRSGDVVVMDNLSSHKAEDVRALIENQDAAAPTSKRCKTKTAGKITPKIKHKPAI